MGHDSAGRWRIPKDVPDHVVPSNLKMNATPEKKRILIVDDQRINIDILRNILCDYERMAAVNGEQALKSAQDHVTPDLILLDIMMPGMDGYEVCRRLKANEKTKEIPIIFITAKIAVEDEIRGFEVGAVDYITKPVNPPVVLARVKTHLALKSAYQSLEQQHTLLAGKERYIRSLIDHSLEMIVSLDNDFNVVEFNHAAEKAFGYLATEVRDQPLRHLFAQEIKFDLLEGLLLAKGSYSGEMAMRRKDDKIFPVFLKFKRLEGVDGEPVGAIGSMRDMTAEKMLSKFMLDRQKNLRG